MNQKKDGYFFVRSRLNPYKIGRLTWVQAVYLFTVIWVCIFSLLLFIHLLGYWQEEFVEQEFSVCWWSFPLLWHRIIRTLPRITNRKTRTLLQHFQGLETCQNIPTINRGGWIQSDWNEAKRQKVPHFYLLACLFVCSLAGTNVPSSRSLAIRNTWQQNLACHRYGWQCTHVSKTNAFLAHVSIVLCLVHPSVSWSVTPPLGFLSFSFANKRTK